MLTILTKSALRWMERHRRRAELRRILETNARQLEDIGLSPTEIAPTQVGRLTETARDHAYRAAPRTMAIDGLH